MREYFLIDLNMKSPDVYVYDEDCLRDDLKAENETDPLELSDHDWKVFDDEDKAFKFLETFKRIKKSLKNSEICESRDFPCMLYKRNYIVLALMKEKASTVRHYKKDWKIGQKFNFHDQTFFLTVKLTAIEELEDGYFNYEYTLA